MPIGADAVAVTKGLAAAFKAELASGRQSRRNSSGVAVVVFIVVPGWRSGCGWFAEGARAVKTHRVPYILSHRDWSDWVIFLKILADLSLSNVVDERGCWCLDRFTANWRGERLGLV